MTPEAGRDKPPVASRLRPNSQCWPWAHDWDVVRVSPPLWDISAKGELWRCRKCPKVKAK